MTNTPHSRVVGHLDALGLIAGEEESPGSPPFQSSDKSVNAITRSAVFAPHYELMRRRCLEEGDNILLQGPSATGKTYSVHQLADEAGMKLYVQQAYSTLPVEDIRGTRGLKDQKTIFEPGQLVLALLDPKGWYLLDEFNLADPGIACLLHNLLDDSRQLTIPETGEIVNRRDGFRFFGTLNPGYVATRELSQAIKSRCVVIDCDYMPAGIEREIILQHCPKVGDGACTIVEIGRVVRHSRNQGEHEFDMCLRTMIQLAKEFAACANLLEAFRRIVLPKVGDPYAFQPVREGLNKAVELLLSGHSRRRR